MDVILNSHSATDPTPMLTAIALRVRDAGETRTPDERIDTARHYRVFPGEGVQAEQVLEMVRRLDAMRYWGDYSFEVFGDDYRQLPLPMVADRARQFVKWVAGVVSRRSSPARRSGRKTWLRRTSARVEAV
jgi:hypothetical protein